MWKLINIDGELVRSNFNYFFLQLIEQTLLRLGFVRSYTRTLNSTTQKVFGKNYHPKLQTMLSRVAHKSYSLQFILPDHTLYGIADTNDLFLHLTAEWDLQPKLHNNLLLQLLPERLPFSGRLRLSYLPP